MFALNRAFFFVTDVILHLLRCCCLCFDISDNFFIEMVSSTFHFSFTSKTGSYEMYHVYVRFVNYAVLFEAKITK